MSREAASEMAYVVSGGALNSTNFVGRGHPAYLYLWNTFGSRGAAANHAGGLFAPS